MSLKSKPIPEVPEETIRVAKAAFPKGNRYMTMRDVFGAIYTDETFADVYPDRGQQRSDSTHILAAVRTMTRLECVGETLRYALNTLSALCPDWVQ